LNPIFSRLKEQNSLPSPLLFVGQKKELLLEEVGDFCRSLIQRRAIDHPDLMFFTLESGSKTYSMETIRMLIHEASLVPFEEPFRYFVLDQVDTMLPVHQNALLKVLEEHPPFIKFILLATSVSPLLPTILSRVKKFFLEESAEQKARFPDFTRPFSELHQKVQNFDEKYSFTDLEDAEAVMHRLNRDTLLWTLEGARAETMHIKKKHLMESFYALFHTQTD